jgi:hypothetical protein
MPRNATAVRELTLRLTAEVFMKRTIQSVFLMASIAASSIVLGVCGVEAQPAGGESLIDASKMPESGPAVVGGTGQTTGPNSKNQAITPMPGMREEELSERPSETIITTPDVRPVTGNPTGNPIQKR